ncbi:hypothetical protein LOTGIDRAFT_156327 [Lottia gigantea]|uniref:VWFA domain-containing protein n=1 Tax=Lottia gigantea TaxID=225164 RepID=V4B800_LOTGI|nr:hypothetical protein LOTGIDRAFT_156327 [Lottia gigantea]ESP03766.1 hypothetical protein LOTGIDRAFT_156327 [Lottia gigantea]
MRTLCILFLGLTFLIYESQTGKLPAPVCQFRQPVDILLVVGDTRTTLRYSLGRTVIAPGVTSFIYNMLRLFSFRLERAGIMAFSDTPRVIAPLSNNFNFINQRMMWWKPEFRGTQTYRALFNVRNYFRLRSRRQSKKIAILMVDGCSDQTDLTVQQAELARQEGITIISMGFSNNVNSTELQKISGDSRYVFGVTNDLFLSSLIPTIMNTICAIGNEVLISSPSTSPITSPVTSPTPPAPLAELILIMDDSESTRDFSGIKYNYNRQIGEFVKTITVNMNLETCHLGIIMVSDTARVLVNLGTNLPTMTSAFGEFAPEFLGTNTVEGYKSATTMFATMSSANSTTRRYLVLVTDGVPMDTSDITQYTKSLEDKGVNLGLLAFNTFHGLVMTTADKTAFLQNSSWYLTAQSNTLVDRAKDIAGVVCP